MSKIDDVLNAYYKKFDDFKPAAEIKSLGVENVSSLKNQSEKKEDLGGETSVADIAKKGIVNKPAGTGMPEQEKVDNQKNVKGETSKPTEGGEKQPLSIKDAYAKVQSENKSGNVNTPKGTGKPDLENPKK